MTIVYVDVDDHDPGWQTLEAGYMELLAFERGWLVALAAQKI